MGTSGSTQGETNDSTPAENASNGPAGPRSEKLSPWNGPSAKAATGTSGEDHEQRVKPTTRPKAAPEHRLRRHGVNATPAVVVGS